MLFQILLSGVLPKRSRKRFRNTSHAEHLKYHCKDLSETQCIATESHVEP
jgi:hypothetical protein